MGIRMTQFIGLPTIARQYLDMFAIKVVTSRCPNCQHELVFESMKTQYDKTFGMFEDEIPLNEYDLANGEKVREVVQASQWSSGPVIFLKLVDEDNNDICVWEDEEMERYL